MDNYFYSCYKYEEVDKTHNQFLEKYCHRPTLGFSAWTIYGTFFINRINSALRCIIVKYRFWFIIVVIWLIMILWWNYMYSFALLWYVWEKGLSVAQPYKEKFTSVVFFAKNCCEISLLFFRNVPVSELSSRQLIHQFYRIKLSAVMFRLVPFERLANLIILCVGLLSFFSSCDKLRLAESLP